MRAVELLESRGLSARAPGETYVSDTDPSDILTIQDITVLPTEGDSYEDYPGGNEGYSFNYDNNYVESIIKKEVNDIMKNNV